MTAGSYCYNLGSAYERIAAAFPERPALVYADGTAITHAALDRLANQVAQLLCGRGLGRRDVVGIVHTKTPACYAIMLGALKLGIAYVNLDEANPAARIRHIFGTSRPKIVFGEQVPASIAEVAREFGSETVNVSDSDFRRRLAASADERPPAGGSVTGSDPAYIMYTSGSTGIPKGAIMCHSGVLNFGAWIAQRFGVTADDVLTNVNPMYFDNSVFDFYGALLNGAALAPISRSTLEDPARLVGEVEQAGCTLWFSVPSLLIYLTTVKAVAPDRLARITRFVFGGEGYPKPELRKLFELYGTRSRLINVYGPTECTCMCSAWDVTAEDLADLEGLVTLGPIAENFSALVLDGDREAGPGETGELCLMGPQVGLGYANDPERTAASFVPNPLNERWPEKMYKTGDLVRRGTGGSKLYFVGRKDNQIKHMGYRIELEEIEAALNRIPGVSQSVVLLRSGRRSMNVLVGYVASERSLDERELRRELENLLPPYMIPQRFEVRRALPKNANGKVDRVALAAEEGSPSS